MKTSFLTIISLLFLSCMVSAQENYSTQPGKVTQYEIGMTEYPQDANAEAVVLYDLGDYFFQGDENRGFVLIMKRKVKIKILKEAGIPYANFEIPYYNDKDEREEVNEIKATTYNMEGGNLVKTSLDSKNIFDEKVNEKTHVKKVALSNVHVGSIVEYSYTIVSPFKVNIREWNFQRRIPVVLSNLKYKAIPYYAYTYILKGANKFDIFSSEAQRDDIHFGNLVYREMEYNFGMKNLPAFKDEEFITSPEDYMVSAKFQLSQIFYPTGGKKDIMSTWPEISNELIKAEEFGKYINNSEKEGKKIVPTLDLATKSPEEQIRIISDFVKSRYSWNKNYGEFAYVNLSTFMKEQKGNVGNINLFLTGLLKASGLDAYPVVLSTRQNGAINRNYPFEQFFNYVIAMVKVGDKIIFVDATEPLLYYSELPIRCINVQALVVKPKIEEWVVTKQKVNAMEQKKFAIAIDPEKKKVNANVTFSGIGYKSYELRDIYEGKNENLAKYLKDNYKIEVSEVKNVEDKGLNKPFEFSFNYNPSIESNDGKLFIQPFCNLNLHENPFKQTKRTLPVDLIFIRGEIYSSTITIPKGYKVEYMPEKAISEDVLMNIAYNIDHSDDKILITASYMMKKNLYDADSYLGLKADFNYFIKKLSDMIVLVKE